MFKKISLTIICILIAVELGFLVGDTYIYCKYRSAKLSTNGKIICEIDNLINFSGMASSK